MPFKSKTQRAYLYANKPSVAKKFAKDSSTTPKPKKKATKKKKLSSRKIGY